MCPHHQWGHVQFCLANNPWIRGSTGYVSSEIFEKFEKSSCIHGMFGTLLSFDLDVSICSLTHWHGVGQKTGTNSVCLADPRIVLPESPVRSAGCAKTSQPWNISRNLPLSLWDPDHMNAWHKVRKSMRVSSYVGS